MAVVSATDVSVLSPEQRQQIDLHHRALGELWLQQKQIERRQDFHEAVIAKLAERSIEAEQREELAAVSQRQFRDQIEARTKRLEEVVGNLSNKKATKG